MNAENLVLKMRGEDKGVMKMTEVRILKPSRCPVLLTLMDTRC